MNVVQRLYTFVKYYSYFIPKYILYIYIYIYISWINVERLRIWALSKSILLKTLCESNAFVLGDKNFFSWKIGKSVWYLYLHFHYEKVLLLRSLQNWSIPKLWLFWACIDLIIIFKLERAHIRLFLILYSRFLLPLKFLVH